MLPLVLSSSIRLGGGPVLVVARPMMNLEINDEMILKTHR